MSQTLHAVAWSGGNDSLHALTFAFDGPLFGGQLDFEAVVELEHEGHRFLSITDPVGGTRDT